MKKKALLQKLLGVVLGVGFGTLAMAAPAFAAQTTAAQTTAGSQTVEQYITSLQTTIKGIAVVFITLSAVTTAILYMVGTVNPKLKDKSKDALYALIIGVVILAFSNDIAKFVGSTLGREITK